MTLRRRVPLKPSMGTTWPVAESNAIYSRDKGLWARVRKTSGCWEWQGHTVHGGRCLGYGHIKHEGRDQKVHRVAWQLTYGRIPDGAFVLHHCDNPACVRPDHLYLGTHQDNMDDKARRGRERGAVGEANAAAVLTDEIVRSLRRRYRAGERVVVMAGELGVNEETVRNAVRGRNWKHIDDVDVALFFAESA